MSGEEQEQYFTFFSYSSRCHLRLEHIHTQQLLLEYFLDKSEHLKFFPAVAKAALFKERYKPPCLMF